MIVDDPEKHEPVNIDPETAQSFGNVVVHARPHAPFSHDGMNIGGFAIGVQP